MPNYVMYIIANQGLEMSSGKLAAQVGHAAVRAYETTDTGLRRQWLTEGECKIILQARDEAHMRNIVDYMERQLPTVKSSIVIDEGRTEVPPLSMTAIGFPVLDKDVEAVKFAFNTFKLYKDKPKTEESSQEELIKHYSAEYDSPRWWRIFWLPKEAIPPYR